VSSDPVGRYVDMAAGLTRATRDTAEKVVRGLVEQSQTAVRDPQELVEQLLERSQENRQALLSIVRSESRRAVKRMGFATQTDLERVQRQVADLRRKLREAERAARQAEAAAAATDEEDTS
jgi:polyhydroxyalkanoate synthesis regulator phasin